MGISSIQWLRYRLMTVEIGGYTFQGWYMYISTLPEAAGLYAIGCKKDENVKLIDVGESGDIRERVENHDRKDCWEDECKDGEIRYAYLRTPGKSKPEREEIEKDIRDKEDPPCGKE